MKTQLLAFHSDPEIKAKYLCRVRAHAKADEIISGTYWEGNNIPCSQSNGGLLLVFPVPQLLIWLPNGCTMNKINPYAFYQFGQIIQPLMQIAPGASVRDWTNSLSNAHEWVKMTSAATILGLRVCVNHAQRLEAAIKAILDLGQDGMITSQHSSEIVGAIMDFQAVFQAEMNDSDTYIVPQRSIFSTHALIENGEKMFSPDVLSKMPELAINDVKQGTRCFAFELPTAAGFHFLRAVEEVIHLHYDVLAKGTPRPNRSAMGIYLDKLIELNAQPELVAVLKQIKDLHRNPLNHPDVVLDMPGAQMVMGLMQSAIFSMMKIVPDPASPIPGLGAATPA